MRGAVGRVGREEVERECVAGPVARLGVVDEGVEVILITGPSLRYTHTPARAWLKLEDGCCYSNMTNVWLTLVRAGGGFRAGPSWMSAAACARSPTCLAWPVVMA